MAANDVRKAVALFVNGKGYAGDIDELEPPKLALKVEEFRAGGMNVPVDLDMGMEKMTASFTLISYDADVLALFGVAPGALAVPFIVREALESLNGVVTPVMHAMTGRITEIDPGTSKGGDKATLKVTMTLDYYRLQHGDRVLQEIDAINMVHVIDGVDRLAAQRAALGI